VVVLFLDEYLNVVEIGTTHNAENVNFLTCFVVRRGRKEKAIMDDYVFYLFLRGGTL